MPITLHPTPELEAHLRESAARLGQPVEQYLLSLAERDASHARAALAPLSAERAADRTLSWEELSDASILIRAVNLEDPNRAPAAEAIQRLRAHGEILVIAPQNIMEFWAVATRPKEERGGLGLSQQGTAAEVARITATFRLLPETQAVFEEWLRLVTQCAVSGKQVHDARLAAWMRVHDVTHILTFNVEDFRGYPSITAVHPRDTVALIPLTPTNP